MVYRYVLHSWEIEFIDSVYRELQTSGESASRAHVIASLFRQSRAAYHRDHDTFMRELYRTLSSDEDD